MNIAHNISVAPSTFNLVIHHFVAISREVSHMNFSEKVTSALSVQYLL